MNKFIKYSATPIAYLFISTNFVSSLSELTNYNYLVLINN